MLPSIVIIFVFCALICNNAAANCACNSAGVVGIVAAVGAVGAAADAAAAAATAGSGCPSILSSGDRLETELSLM
jgi:hypothetical protein